MVKVYIRLYRESLYRAKNLELKVLRLYRQEEARVSRHSDVVELLAELSRRYASEASLIEVMLKWHDGSERVLSSYTESVTRSPRELLFPEPAKLVRIGLVYSNTTSLPNIEWHHVKDDVYVYEGEIKVPDGVKAVIIETDKGLRVISRT